MRYVVLMLVAIMSVAVAASNYIPETGCWTYPDKVVCMEPSPVNATVFIKNVSCYEVDQYGTGAWVRTPCIADAEIKPTNVVVCYKMLPIENGKPNIQGYTDKYNCQTETWSGNAVLYIPYGKAPWNCELKDVDNYTKRCEIQVNKMYSISGAGNDVNGTKAILVGEIREESNSTMYLAIALAVLIGGYLVYRRYRPQ